MTLYDLTQSMTIQGNIRIHVFDANGSEKEIRSAADQDDFSPHLADMDDIEDLTVTYIYPTKEVGGMAWLNIEVAEED